MKIDGGAGDDTFTQGAASIASNAAGTRNLSSSVQLFGGDGNDKFGKFTGTSANLLEIDAGAGNDKFSGGLLGSGGDWSAVDVEMGDGDDIVYGFDGFPGQTDRAETIELGSGNDVYFGGSYAATVDVYGGDGNDKIFGPSFVNQDVGGYGNVTLDGGDGDDLIDLGDQNYGNYGYGGAGNDKIIGGISINGQKLFGDEGDDKIWMINPE